MKSLIFLPPLFKSIFWAILCVSAGACGDKARPTQETAQDSSQNFSIAADDYRRESSEAQEEAPEQSKSNTPTEMEGYVGKLKAIFTFNLHHDQSLEGTYYHPAQPQQQYQLSGTWQKEGELTVFQMQEYTDKQPSARIELRGNMAGGVLKGTMYNTDGRRFKMFVKIINPYSEPFFAEDIEESKQVNLPAHIEKDVKKRLQNPQNSRLEVYFTNYQCYRIEEVAQEGCGFYSTHHYLPDGTWSATYRYDLEEDLIEKIYANAENAGYPYERVASCYHVLTRYELHSPQGRCYVVCTAKGGKQYRVYLDENAAFKQMYMLP